MKTPVLKDIIKGTAKIISVMSGGKIEYELTDINGIKWQLFIDASDKHDVGETASFMAYYDKAIILMRWIRRSIDNNELYEIK